MKILEVTPAYEPAWHLGGVVCSVSQMCRRLAQLGHQVTVFTTNSGGDRYMPVPLNRPVEVGKVEVYYFRCDFTPRYGFSKALREACRQEVKNYDLVHISSLWWYPGIPAGEAARKHDIPYVISTTGGLTPYSLSQKRFKKWLYLNFVEDKNFRRAAAIRYTSEWERRESNNRYSNTPNFIVPNGLDIGEFVSHPEKRQARSDYNIPPESNVVVFLGRLHRVKGLEVLIKASAILIKKIPNIILILAGPDDGCESNLKKLAGELNIASRVVFTGPIPPEKRNSLFRAADIFALPSFHENFGNAAVEAMLAGVPVLVSENVGIGRQIVADGAGKVAPREEQAVARAIEQMLADPEGLRGMGEAAAAAARRRYDIDAVARRMVTAYEDILTGRRSAGLSWSDD